MHPAALQVISPTFSEFQPASSSPPVTHAPLGGGQCYHLPLPSPQDIECPSPLSNHTKSLFNLHFRRHKVKQLLQWTKRCWDDPEYQAYRDSTEAKGAIIEALACVLPAQHSAPGTAPKWEDLRGYHSRIIDLFFKFDACFFFGTLSGRHSGYKTRFADLYILDYPEEHLEAALTSGKHAYGATTFESLYEMNTTRLVSCRINIYPKPPQEPQRYLSDIVETLLHEMIHAYIELFACTCNSCRGANSMYIGETGHGAAFSLIQLTIAQEIRKWDKRLESFMSGAESDLVHVFSLVEEMDARGASEYTMPPRHDHPEFSNEWDALVGVLFKFGLEETPEEKKKKKLDAEKKKKLEERKRKREERQTKCGRILRKAIGKVGKEP